MTSGAGMHRRIAALAWTLASGLAAAQPVTYAIDPTHTFVLVEADHRATSTVRGRFDRSAGTVVLDRGARTGRVELRVEAASLGTGVKSLDARLKGPAFLDAARWPQLAFVAERLAFDGDRVVAVEGALTLRGATAPLALQAVRFGCYTNPLLRREVCGGDFEAEAAPAAWGLAPAPGTRWPDRVRVRVQVEAIRQAADERGGSP
ncbi:MAG TPA: YceI family protein [Albitalea sp.]